MKRLILILTLLTVILPDLRAERVGLVLSGGGAKGIAHIAMIQALEDNDIPVDYITGTSMGAIIGALYSCGFTPKEMMNLFLSPEFADWSSGTLNRDKVYFVSKTRGTPRMFNINFSRRDSANIFSYIPSHLISPMPMNMEFLKLFGPYSVQCRENFDSLFVPYRCVTSDIYHKHKVVCRSGSVGEAVRQSMSFPLVFKPIERDGVLVYDGGIYDNFPVDVMKEEFAPDVMIGSNVSGPDGKPIPGNVYSQLEDMIIQNNDYSLPDSLGIKVNMPVRQFGVLDWDKAQEIYDIGYRTAMEKIDSIKMRVKARRPKAEVAARRSRFNAATPQLYFNKVETSGVGEIEKQYLDYVFNPRGTDSISIDQVENSYYRVVSRPIVSDLEPTMKITPQGNILQVKPELNDRWNASLGAWLTTATNSMLFLSGSYNTLRFNAFDASLNFWFGQSYIAGMADFRYLLRRQAVSYLSFQGVLSRQKYYNDQVMFFKNDAPMFLTDYENYAKISYVREFGRIADIFASVGYSYRHDDYYADALFDEHSALHRDKSQYRIWMLQTGLNASTLDNEMYPSLGSLLEVHLTGLHVSQRFIPQGDMAKTPGFTPGYKWMATAKWKKYFPINKWWTLGASAEGAATIGPLRQNYVAELIQSPEFAPTPSMVNYFNPAFRSPSFVAIGAMPIWSPLKNFQARGDLYLYCPVRHMTDVSKGIARYDGWMKDPQFFGELAVVYNFPFASLSLYGNYMSSPKSNWNFGLSFGLLFPAPRFIN